ncbi:MAG: RecT family recombinase [Bacteroidota bacterium]
MSTALQRVDTRQGATRALAPNNLSPDQVALIKATVAKGASDNELKLFLHLAQTYGLDPFAKEIWCIKYGNNPATIFTSRDGYLKIANGHPAFEGIAGDVVRQADTFEVTSGEVRHTYAAGDRGPIVGAYAQVFRSDRRVPAYVFAPFAEYNAGKNPTWRNYPSAMILKVAEAMALKRAFSISGLVTREELDRSQDSRPQRTPSDMLYGGPTEAEAAAARQLKAAPRPKPEPQPAPLLDAVEDAEVINEAVDPDAIATACAERLDLVETASGETLRAWLDELADWPDPFRSRLGAAIRAQAARFRS